MQKTELHIIGLKMLKRSGLNRQMEYYEIPIVKSAMVSSNGYPYTGYDGSFAEQSQPFNWGYDQTGRSVGYAVLMYSKVEAPDAIYEAGDNKYYAQNNVSETTNASEIDDLIRNGNLDGAYYMKSVVYKDKKAQFTDYKLRKASNITLFTCE